MVGYLGDAASKILLSADEKTRVVVYIVISTMRMRVIRGVIMGKCGTGKTTFLMHARDAHSCSEIAPTIGVDNVTIPYESVTLRCWDTSGDARFKEIIPMFVRKADVAIYAFDTSDPESIEEAIRWYHFAGRQAEPPAINVFLGNIRRAMPELGKYAFPSPHVYTASAIENYDVDYVFRSILELCVESPPPSTDASFSLHMLRPKQTRTRECTCCNIS